jgi:hypothetical protein
MVMPSSALPRRFRITQRQQIHVVAPEQPLDHRRAQPGHDEGAVERARLERAAASSGVGDALAGIAVGVGKAAAVVVGISRFIVPRLLGWVDASRSREVFLLAIPGPCIGTAGSPRWPASRWRSAPSSGRPRPHGAVRGGRRGLVRRHRRRAGPRPAALRARGSELTAHIRVGPTSG